MANETTEDKDIQKASLSEAYLNLDLTALTDRGASSAAIMDKSGIRIFDIPVEQQINRHGQTERKKLSFYKTEAFSGGFPAEDGELEAIKQQVFLAVPEGVNRGRSVERMETAGGSRMMLMVILAVGIIISAAYAHKKKRERERKIADLNNRYDE